jgi:hypothetical protein
LAGDEHDVGWLNNLCDMMNEKNLRIDIRKA